MKYTVVKMIINVVCTIRKINFCVINIIIDKQDMLF